VTCREIQEMLELEKQMCERLDYLEGLLKVWGGFWARCAVSAAASVPIDVATQVASSTAVCYP
jgi:hypothetical protein